MDEDKVGMFVNEIWRDVSTYINFIGSSLNSFLEPTTSDLVEASSNIDLRSAPEYSPSSK